MDDKILSVVTAKNFAVSILKALGLTTKDATAVADGLVAANLRGVHSHGILRLTQYAKSIRDGSIRLRPNITVLSRNGASTVIDADGGYGYRPTLCAARHASEASGDYGIGLAVVRNSHHFGAAGYYADWLAAQGRIGIVMANTQPVIGMPGSPQPLVGNNPLAIAAPRATGQPPISLDIAMSQVAFGKVRLAAAEGAPIPDTWALGPDGSATQDAAAALEAGSLMAMGGHKGFGLAIMINILSGVLSGSPFGMDTDAHGRLDGGVGHSVIAINPEFFLEYDQFIDRVEEMVSELQAIADRAGYQLTLPGGPEAEQQRRNRNSFPISGQVWSALNELGSTFESPIQIE